jgi:hypothetical protein
LIGLAVLALTLLGAHLVRRSARRVNCRSTWRGAGGRSRSEELRQSSSDCCQVLQGAVAVDAYVDRRAAP